MLFRGVGSPSPVLRTAGATVILLVLDVGAGWCGAALANQLAGQSFPTLRLGRKVK